VCAVLLCVLCGVCCVCLLCVCMCVCVFVCVCACVSVCADIHIGLRHKHIVCDPHSQLFLRMAPFHTPEFDNFWVCLPLTRSNFRIPAVIAACDHSQTVDTAFLRCTVTVESSCIKSGSHTTTPSM